ncbi:leucine-rich repeat domain-containing protein [Tenacibaculum agarivorans]|uniref:hypothetical protein n=1 Tax=Tenacibaculum agarivorans TaxID=1908389 RepID=UPI00094B8DC5|nr:hypothetical protein [Tenacibaculum agarivorans]
MKKYILFVVFNVIAFTINAQYTQIPDDNFEAALAKYDDNPGDNQIPTEEIENIAKLDVSNLGINNLSGIEDFIFLEELNCSGNNLTSLNVSDLSTLAILRCNDNALTSLNIGGINSLEELYCQNNELNSIDITSATDISFLYCSGNNISSIDFSSSDFLEVIDCSENDISSLTLNNLGDLEELYCNDNNLTSLDLQFNPNVNTVNASDNNITSFNGENLEVLETLTLSRNPLSEIDLSELIALRELVLVTSDLTSLDVSKNVVLTDIQVTGHSIESFDFRKNTLLKQLVVVSSATKYINVQNGNNSNITFATLYGDQNLCVAVNDLSYAQSNWTNVQSTDIYTEDFCRYTQIPDTNFENALSAYDNIANDGQVPTINIENLTSLSLNEKGIQNTTGIEDFVALTSLSLRENSFSTIDLSNNTLLESVDLNEATSLETINLTGLSKLTYLDLNQTNISEVDISDAVLLEYADLSTSNLSTLDVTNNTLLDDLDVAWTNLSALDLSKCVNLTEFRAYNADLYSLNIKNGNNAKINSFDVRNNPNLTCILVDDANVTYLSGWSKNSSTNFSDTYCRYTQIPDINFEAALETLIDDDESGDGQVPTALIEVMTTLNVSDASITDLTGIKDFKALQVLDIEGNNIVDLDISGMDNLLSLEASAAITSSLDASNTSSLTTINIYESDISSIDLTNAEALEELYVYRTLIDTLDVSTSNELTRLIAFETPNLKSIDLTDAAVLRELELYRSSVVTLDLSTNIGLESITLFETDLSSLNLQNGNNGNIGFINIKDNTNLYCVEVDNPSYSNTNWTNKDSQTVFSLDCQTLLVSPSVVLEGAFELDNSGTAPTLMRDDLNDEGYLPTTSPYGDGAVFEGSSFSGSDDTSIVDWVEIQLRNPNNINEILYRQSAKLQQGGLIVGVNTENVEFSAWSGLYYIAIAHRNHLTIVSNTTHTLSSESTLELDMKTVANVFNGTSALVDMGNGYFAMPMGDVDENGQVQNADISNTVLQIGISGYSIFDVDMNGQVQNSDVNTILQNIGIGEQF